MAVYESAKRIYENLPVSQSNGQYNYGKIEASDANAILGFINEGMDETHLCTTVETGSLYPEGVGISLEQMKKGIPNGKKSIFEVNKIYTRMGTNMETEGKWHDVGHALYYIDGAYIAPEGECNHGINAYETFENIYSTNNWGIGNHIKNHVICTGDGFGQTDGKNRLHKKIKDYDPSNSSDNFYWSSVFEGNGNSSGPSGGGIGAGLVHKFANETLQLYNFHLSGHQYYLLPGTEDDAQPSGPTFSANQNIINFSNGLRGENSDNENGYMYFMVRLAGDERERRTGGHRADERDRSYGIARIDKRNLAKIFYQTQQHTDYSPLEWDWDHNKRQGKSSNGTNNGMRFISAYDSFGDNKGYKRGHENEKQVVQWTDSGKFTFKGPTFNILTKLLPYGQGGANACYVNKEQDGWWCVDTVKLDNAGNELYRFGLNPRYTFDAIGLPAMFKNTFDDNGRLNSSNNEFLQWYKIDVPYRAISKVITVNPAELDLQNYYDGFSITDELNKTFSSAPGKMNLNFDIAKSYYDSNISQHYINFSDTDDNDPYKDFDYWFFVVNWDWKSPEPKTINEIGESFPKTTDELQALQNTENTYKLYKIGQKEIDMTEGTFIDETDCDNYDESFHYNICGAEHTYLNAGMKVIKAVIFRTVPVDTLIQQDENNISLNNFIQALDWQVATVKIIMSEQGFALEADFGDVGGDDFIYLPYPDNYQPRINIMDETGESEPLQSPSGDRYKTSHLVVS